MASNKVYIATEATVQEIRDYVKPVTLGDVDMFILDFTSPDLYIVSGALDTQNRTISA